MNKKELEQIITDSLEFDTINNTVAVRFGNDEHSETFCPFCSKRLIREKVSQPLKCDCSKSNDYFDLIAKSKELRQQADSLAKEANMKIMQSAKELVKAKIADCFQLKITELESELSDLKNL